jgi:hypothetical protein
MARADLDIIIIPSLARCGAVPRLMKDFVMRAPLPLGPAGAGSHRHWNNLLKIR